MTTTREALGVGIDRLRAAAVDTPRLDAEVLFAYIAGVDRTGIRAHPEALVSDGQLDAFQRVVERRAAGEPVAYIRGMKEFHGLALTADPRALIPRPETERLVDLGLAETMRRLAEGPRLAQGERLAEGAREPAALPVRIADVGTGSGAVAVALAVALRQRRVPAEDVTILATDVSPDALDLARENAVSHAVGDRVEFVEADLLPPGAAACGVVLANLPYVRSAAMSDLPRPTTYEPPSALDGGVDGLTLIARLLDRLPAALVPDGVAMLEIGADQGEAIRVLLDDRLPGWPARIETDLAGLPRVAVISRPPS